MKKLSWLFNRLRLFKFLPIFFVQGCFLTSSVEEGGSDQSAFQFIKQKFVSKQVPVFQPSTEVGGKSVHVATLKKNFCNDNQFGFEVSLKTPLGPYLLEYSHPSQQASVRIEKNQFEFTADLGAPEFQDYCQNPSTLQNGILVLKDSSWVQKLEKNLAQLLPDCRLELLNEGWSCRLEGMSVKAAEDKLSELQKDVLIHWKRLPYLFSRRLATARMLSSAFEHNDALDHVCKVLSVAMPKELPLSFASKKWRLALCSPSTPETLKKELAQIALNKAIVEFEFVNTLSQETSKVGLLSVRIPQAPTRELWVKLEPGADVEKLTLETLRTVWHQDTPSAGCWHPLFESDPENLQYARIMGLIASKGGEIQCPRLSEHTASLLGQMTQTLLAEASFVVSNGTAKTLRLPQGSYRYTLFGVDGNIPDLEAPPLRENDTTTGAITWQRRQPDPVITQW